MMTNASEYIKDHIFEKVARNQKVVQNEKSCSKYKTCQKVPKQLVESPLYIISINKTITKESKQMKTRTFVFVVSLKSAVMYFEWLP